jgi:hypothetical protein
MNSNFLHRIVLNTVFITSALSAHTADAASFKFEWIYDGHTTIGFFNGTENGNIISNTSLTSLLFDNNIITPTGGVWYSSSQALLPGLFGPELRLTPTNGQLSFDGEENNVLFSSEDIPSLLLSTPQFFSYSDDIFTSIPNTTNLSVTSINAGGNSGTSEINYQFSSTPDVTGWSVTRVGQVPEPGILLLLASGIASLRCFRRRVA